MGTNTKTPGTMLGLTAETGTDSRDWEAWLCVLLEAAWAGDTAHLVEAPGLHAGHDGTHL